MSSPRSTAYQRPAAPARKGLAITSLVLGVVGLFTCGLAGLGAIVGLVLGIVALVKESREPRVYGGRGLAIGGVILNGLGILVLPIAAAIAIPSLLRARVAANEAAAIGDVRTVISAQAAYASANGGHYDGRLECLLNATSCIRGYSGSPSFLDPALVSSEPRHGYKGRVVAGPSAAASAAESTGSMSPTSVSGFAYLATPVQFGRTGVRAFCGDANGMICATPDGRAPGVTPAGECDLSTCQVVN